MANPYNVLGVNRSSTDEEIKNAYLNLVEKYSPVNYSGNPLADLADKKMQEVNDAYDSIMAERRVGSADSGQWESADGTGNTYGPQSGSYQSSASSSSNDYYQSASSNPEYRRAREYINQNNYQSAESILLNIPAARRDAEWNYLMGRVMQQKGWLEQAAKYYDAAARLDPNNPDYRSAAQSMNARRNGRSENNPYNRSYNTNSNSTGCSGCDVCSSLICADCCCECMGSDLIRCC